MNAKRYQQSKQRNQVQEYSKEGAITPDETQEERQKKQDRTTQGFVYQLGIFFLVISDVHYPPQDAHQDKKVSFWYEVAEDSRQYLD